MKRYSQREDKKLLKLRLSGKSLATIAAAMSRAKSSTQLRLAHLAALEEKSEVRVGKFHYRPKRINQ